MLKRVFFVVCSLLYVGISAQEVERLSDQVNSPYYELAPYITPDGKRLYFVVRGHPSNTKYNLTKNAEDIWYSDLQPNGEWGKAQHMEKPFNRVKYNAIIATTVDGSKIYIGGYYKDGEYVKKGYSVSELTPDGWSLPQGIEVKDYAEMCVGNYISECFSADGKILITSMNEKGEENINDLYVSFQQPDGSYTRPKKLPYPINTEHGEGTPFLASDNRTLYFASNRNGGLGGFDMYMSRRLDDTWEKWSEPVNLGEPINTPSSEAFFTIPAKGDYAYFVRIIGDNSDIVRTKLRPEHQPTPVVIVNGDIIFENTTQIINYQEVNIVYYDLRTQQTLGKADIDPVNKKYKIVLPVGKKYGIKADVQGFYSMNYTIDLTETQSYKEEKLSISIKELKKGNEIVLNNLFFDFNKATLKPESFYELNELAETLKNQTNLRIEIAGHTDNVGADDYNLKLSQERAQAVVNYLVQKGVSKDRLVAKGYGKTKPIAPNTTEQGRAQNRRVELRVL